jgi:hypothetical protein
MPITFAVEVFNNVLHEEGVFTPFFCFFYWDSIAKGVLWGFGWNSNDVLGVY